VHGYLGVKDRSPAEFRDIGRRQTLDYAIDFLAAEVQKIECGQGEPTRFSLHTDVGEIISARKLLLATGTRDILPEIENCRQLFGKYVHHCPYCDGWEHRGQKLVALGKGSSAFKLAVELRTWSRHVAVCSSGEPITAEEQAQASCLGMEYRPERPLSFDLDSKQQLGSIRFETGVPLSCDAVFFSGDQVQNSELALAIGCQPDKKGLMQTQKKQHTSVSGVFIAGDADGDVQFAIVAAAEGAIAASAINRELQAEDWSGVEESTNRDRPSA
jgi:thioredoxin reductase